MVSYTVVRLSGIATTSPRPVVAEAFGIEKLATNTNAKRPMGILDDIILNVL